MEQTLIIIKPDGVKRKLVGEILQRFERKQLIIRQLKVGIMTRDLAEEHYAHVKKFDFFEDMITYMTSSEVVYLILEGDSVIKTVRKMIGATNCLEAAPGTIRGDYGNNSYHNIIHASDSPEAARIEINRFFGS
ncbi:MULTISPECIES: nucleoside-diphosphate kinase [unclassified Enterococcus]|uniref:nucleoside-diphosphate kinase n=1 Tax=unclassified Enterococcus TaxID=2608891 RepID=UPI001CE146A0|nr:MULTISPECIES: nucleoside-diphosphate kinase [unclassified Enterococcus]MCA5013585.1 nucleoside-diphosphate kinase [Enterococcus sp. S23]MCA5016835.1 nucleoside-diphosphate kinase [Enterococcus sp. S22(2020)]